MRSFFFVASLFVGLIALAPRPAHADEASEVGSTLATSTTAPPHAPERKAETPTEWYGWQTLLVDASAFTIGLGGAAAQSDPLAYTGLGIYAFGPPLIHAAHGRPIAGLGDLALRVAAPLGFGFLGVRVSGDSWLSGTVIGFILGTGVASAIDAAFIAREPIAPPPQAARSFTWAPSVAVTPRGASAGVVGTF